MSSPTSWQHFIIKQNIREKKTLRPFKPTYIFCSTTHLLVAHVGDRHSFIRYFWNVAVNRMNELSYRRNLNLHNNNICYKDEKSKN